MKRIQTKVSWCMGAAIIILVISFSISVRLIKQVEINTSENDLRLEINPQVQKIQKGIYEKGEYPYLVVSMEDEILYNDTELSYKTGETVNLTEVLQQDDFFFENYPGVRKEVFVLESQGENIGFVIYLIPEEFYATSHLPEEFMKCMWPLAIGIFLSSLLLIYHIIQLHRKVLQPIKEISASAKAMIQGNYDLEVLRTYEETVRENEIGDLIYSFELMRDELKEKQLREEALKQSQQELISCISHDLRTPISTIKAYVEGIRDGIANTDEKRTMFIGIILQKVNLLSTMIKELLEYSNTQLNQLSIERKEVYFRDYWEKLARELRIFCKQQNAQLEYNQLTEDVIVLLDTKRIQEVMYNLVENSIKYRSDEALKICLMISREEHYLKISVSDNGIGVHNDDIVKIFDKFYRAEKSRTSSVPGSGLGLSICKYIVEQHGGEIYCKSKKGCEIGFTIPIV